MQFDVQPGGRLHGTIRVPGDKSISHRSVILGALAQGTSNVTGFLPGEDTLNTLRAFEAMGVRVERWAEADLRIHGVGLEGLKAPSGDLDCGNSGTGMRLLAGLLAGQRFPTRLIGDESLSRRPMRRVLDPLARMGALVRATAAGTAPLAIEPVPGGLLKAIDYVSPVASAQVKSCVLLAGLYADGPTAVTEPVATRDHSERMLAAFGAQLTVDGLKVSILPRPSLQAQNIVVPSDFSSAAFFLVGAAIAPGSDLTIQAVGMNPRRTGLLDCLREMGAHIDVLEPRTEGGEPVADLRIRGSDLKGIEVPSARVADMIDEFPALFVAAACAQGVTVIRGAEELRVKESDRLASMAAGLRTLGIRVEESTDGAVIHGGVLTGGVIDSHGDHRIAMSFAIAGLRASGPIRILDCANVATSFPGFAQLAHGAGLGLAVTNPV